MKQKIFLSLLLFAAALVLFGCTTSPMPSLPSCGDGICETNIEDNTLLPTYCPTDCN